MANLSSLTHGEGHVQGRRCERRLTYVSNRATPFTSCNALIVDKHCALMMSRDKESPCEPATSNQHCSSLVQTTHWTNSSITYRERGGKRVARNSSTSR